jgi:hypothetical protein
MAYRTDGSSALKYDDLSGSNDSSVSKPEAKIINLDDYRNAVEKKIAEISQTATENLNGDKNLTNELRSEVRSIIREEEIKTSREEIDDLAEIISKKLGRENNSEFKIEAKKIRLEINKWKEENIKEVNEFRKEEFKNEFEEETKKLNPNLKSEELIKIKECGKLISDVYFDESVIENQKDESLEFNKQQYSPGQLENAWTDLKGVTNFLKRTPGQIKDIKEKYSSIKDGLKNINLPNNLKEVRSFDKVISIFSNEGANGLFNKTILKIGQNFVDKIGNQAIGEFAKNSLNVLAKEGFQKGFGTILNGILSGGVKTVATTAAGSAAVTGGVAAIGAATGPPGWLITAALTVGKFIKDKLGKIAESLGISGKKFLEENFGKVGGKIISGIVSLVALPGVLIGTISATVIGPILIAVFVFLFGYQMFQGSLVSSLVPPKGNYIQEQTDYNDGSSVINYGDYAGVVGTYVKNGLTFHVFEKGSIGGRMSQRYDLGVADKANLKKINDVSLDIRAIEAYKAMVVKARADGIPTSELGLISGYRDIATQTRLWNDKIAEYRAEHPNWTQEQIEQEARIWVATPGGSPHHTGRAIDIVVNGGTTASGGVEKQKNSATFQWLYSNAADFGFYNYAVEPWHWEYNPPDLTTSN